MTDYAGPEALAQRLVSDLTNLLSRRIGVADAAMAERLATLERIADEAIAAKAALERRVRELSEQQTLKDATIRSLNAAVEALTAQAQERQEVSGIETALQQLAANNVSDAVAIFQKVLDRKEAEGKRKEAESKKALRKAAAAARHLGALASLQDTQGAWQRIVGPPPSSRRMFGRGFTSPVLNSNAAIVPLPSTLLEGPDPTFPLRRASSVEKLVSIGT